LRFTSRVAARIAVLASFLLLAVGAGVGFSASGTPPPPVSSAPKPPAAQPPVAPVPPSPIPARGRRPAPPGAAGKAAKPNLDTGTGPLLNAGFETGNLPPWQTSGSPSEGGTPIVTDSYQGCIAADDGQTCSQIGGPVFTPHYGVNFAIVPAGCSGEGGTQTLYQSFLASSGQTISGASFFKANDYMPYNDTATVNLVDTSNDSVVAQLFSDSVSNEGDFNSVGWTDWSYTIDSAGSYAIVVDSTNDQDCYLSSVVGIDMPQLGVPTPLGPPNAEPISGSSTTIEWSNIDGATGYDLRLQKDSGAGCDTSSVTPISLSPVAGDNQSYPTGTLAPGHYCWDVQATDGVTGSGYDETFEFSVPVPPPDVPTLSSPDDGSTTGHNDPIFTWSNESESGATGYEIQIVAKGESCSFSGKPLYDAITTDPTFTPEGTLADGTYCWRVESTGDGGTNGFSDPFTFTVDTTPADVPTPTAPSDGSTVTTSSPTLQWTDESGSGAVSYDVEYGTAGEGGSCSFDSTDGGLTSTSDPLSGLEDGTYCWHVRSVDEAGNQSDWSDTFTFTIDTTPPDVPTPTAPSDGSTVTTSSPTLQWSDESGSGAATYDVAYGTPVGAGGCSFDSSDPGLTSTSDPLSGLADGTYCWHVRAVDEFGNQSDYSDTVTFTVETTPEVTIVSASPDTIGPGQTSTIIWHASRNGTFSVRVGGSSCTTGTQVGTGSYSSSPGNVTSTVTGPALSPGANTVRVCVTSDSQTGSDTTTVTLDATSPTFSNVPSGVSAEATGPSGAAVTYTKPTASDVDDSAGPVSCAPVSGSTFPLGTSTVTCSSTDTHGNTGTAKFTVNVKDTTPPSLTVPADITVAATSSAGAVVTFTDSATDTVDSNPSVSCSPASGSTFPVGTTKVTCTATDASGNSTSKSFNVTVTQGSTPPPPPPPPPVTGPTDVKQLNAQPVPGKPEAKVKLPGTNTFVPLSQAKDLPKGTTIDVTGQAQIDLSDPKGNEMIFFGQNDGVPSQFVFQGTVGGVVQLSLVGGNLKGYRSPSAFAAKSKKPARRLWGSGKGKFTSKGKYASATVKGTIWLIADYSDHTLVTVRRGLVSVKDFVTNKTKLVPAGHSIIVHAKTKKTIKK
jgi:HYR domain